MHLLDLRQLQKPVQSLTSTDETINQLVANHQGDLIAGCDDNGHIFVKKLCGDEFDTSFKRTLHHGHTNICSAITFRPDRPWDIISAGYDQRILQWDYSKKRIYSDINISEVGVHPSKFDSYVVNPPFIHSMSLCQDGKFLACGTDNHLVQVFDSSKKHIKFKATLKKHKGSVGSVLFARTSAPMLFTGSDDKTCCLWDLRDIEQAPAAADGVTNGVAHNGVNGEGDHSEGAAAAEVESFGEATISPRYTYEHGHKINCVATGENASTKFFVIGDTRNTASVYQYPV